MHDQHQFPRYMRPLRSPGKPQPRPEPLPLSWTDHIQGIIIAAAIYGAAWLDATQGTVTP